MNVTLTTISETTSKLTVLANEQDLSAIKQHVLKKLTPKVKVQGFREGKVPPAIAEKNLDPNYVQSEVLDDAVNHFYSDAVVEKRLRVVAQPKIELTKFVPYTELEFTAEVETIGAIKLPDYKKTSAKKEAVKVTAADVEEVLARLQAQGATYSVVDRAAKLGDRVTIDFAGSDKKGPVANADGKEYPLVLGSKSFIPGFEEEVVGLKKGEEKKFDITFPADYGNKALQSKKVTFAITVHKVEEATEEPIDDEFASKVGPFKNLGELKEDIKKQITAERETQAERAFEDAIIKELVKKSKIAIPAGLLAEQVEAVDNEFKQTLMYRGQTFQEYLDASGQTESQYREKELTPAAEERIKAGLILSEIAEAEGLTVTPEELEIRVQILKGQYASDAQMQAELDKPENRRDVASRLLTEKTIAKIVSFTK
jgi:trigger factor